MPGVCGLKVTTGAGLVTHLKRHGEDGSGKILSVQSICFRSRSRADVSPDDSCPVPSCLTSAVRDRTAWLATHRHADQFAHDEAELKLSKFYKKDRLLANVYGADSGLVSPLLLLDSLVSCADCHRLVFPQLAFLTSQSLSVPVTRLSLRPSPKAKVAQVLARVKCRHGLGVDQLFAFTPRCSTNQQQYKDSGDFETALTKIRSLSSLLPRHTFNMPTDLVRLQYHQVLRVRRRVRSIYNHRARPARVEERRQEQVPLVVEGGP